MAYEDNTILTFGKYKFLRLVNIPPSHLLKIYKNKSCRDKELIKYIEDNLEKLIYRESTGTHHIIIEGVCEKITYPNEKEAKFKLAFITSVNQSHKKPTRAYECDKCGGWHLTSMPIEIFNKKEK